MKNYRSFVIALAALAVISCGQKAGVKGIVTDAPDSQLIVKRLEINTFSVLDTIKTAADGSFAYSIDVAKGDPEFVYFFYNDKQIASLLIEAGQKVKVTADTLGHFEVSGSEGSEKLAEVTGKYSDFLSSLVAAEDMATINSLYLSHYRECVKYVMTNSKSLTVIPVLYETVGGSIPVFGQNNDAILFRNIADSLKTVYPDSRYVKALEKDAASRVNAMAISNAISMAQTQSFPNIILPDMKGVENSLAEVDAKVVLVHFWDASDAVQKMTNVEILLPIYNDLHDKGFEIYSVCLDTDKAEWGSVVQAQKLPWINVNDGRGAACPAVASYGVSSLPYSILIVDGEIKTVQASSAAGLRSEISRQLR